MTDMAKILESASRKDQTGAVTATRSAPLRGDKGRFQTAERVTEAPKDAGKKSKSQEVQAEQRDKTEKKSIYQTLKSGFERVAPLRNAADSFKGKGQESEEVVAKAMGGGPFFEAATEIKGAIDNIRDEESPIGKAARWAGQKAGVVKKDDAQGPADTGGTVDAIEKRQAQGAAAVQPGGLEGQKASTEHGTTARLATRNEKGRFVSKEAATDVSRDEKPAGEKKAHRDDTDSPVIARRVRTEPPTSTASPATAKGAADSPKGAKGPGATTMTDIPAVKPGEKPTARENGPGSSETRDRSRLTRQPEPKEPPAVTARPVETDKSNKGGTSSPGGKGEKGAGIPTADAEIVAIASTDEAEEIIGVLESLMDIAAKSQLLDEKHSAILVKTIEKRSLAQYWEMAMTVKSIADKVRDPNSDLRKGAGKIAGKLGLGNRIRTKQTTGRQEEATATASISTVTIANPESISNTIISELQSIENEDKKRHGELIKAVLQGSKGSAGTGMPSPRNMGPGARGRERRLGRIEGRQRRVTATPAPGTLRAPRTPRVPGGGLLSAIPGATLPGGNRPAGGGWLDGLASMAMKVAPALAAVAALPLGAIAAGVGATTAAIGAVGAAGYSAVTGKDNFISKGAQKVGLVPKLETDASGKIAGVVDAGKGYTTTVDASGDVVKRSGARNWRNNNPGNIQAGDFAKGQGAMGSDGRFAVFPDYQTGRNAKEKLIFDTNKYKNKSLTDAIARYAPPGENNTAAYQQAVLATVGGKNKKMSEYSLDERQKIMDKMEQVEGFKKGKVEIVGKVPVTAQQPTQLAKKAEKEKPKEEARREDQPKTFEGEASRQAAATAVPVAPKKEDQQKIIEGEAVRRAGEVPAPTVAEATFASAPPAPIAATTATPVTDARKRIMARNRARLAIAGAGSLEARPVDGAAAITTLAAAKATPQEPVTSLASAVTARPSPPERMTTTARADTVSPEKQTQGPASQGGMDMSGVFMAAIAKLNSAVSKMAEGRDEVARPGGQQIRTEFDDTMLTLMAYDRV